MRAAESIPTLREMVRTSYRLAVGVWSIQPSEFWRMEPAEWMWLWEQKREPEPEEKLAGSLTRRDVTELAEFMRQHERK